MLGVIAGDVIGSRFEWAPIKTTDFSLFHPLCSFTDDTVLTVATGGVAHAFYRVMPDPIVQEVRGRLPDEFLRVVDEFEGKFRAARSDS